MNVVSQLREFPQHIHLIGIGGDGVSAIAGLLLSQGKKVSGSEQEDKSRVKQTQLLQEFTNQGATIFYGHDAKNLTSSVGLVIRSSLIGPDNPEVVEANRRGIPVIKRSQALGMLMDGKIGLSFAGGAGKSTSSAMAGFVLSEIGKSPTIAIGARSPYLGNKNFQIGDGEFFIAEADEFDGSFLDLKQETAVITNMLYGDHMDYYPTPKSMYQAFSDFIKKTAYCFVRLEDSAAVNVVKDTNVPFQTFGFNKRANWQAFNIDQKVDGTHFTFKNRLRNYQAFIHLPGIHNVANALGVIALLDHYGVDPLISVRILENFRGLNRRLEKRNNINGVDIYDDYGHNKLQIDATLDALRQIHPSGKIYCVFQPRQFRRTKERLFELLQTFNNVDGIGILDISKGLGDTELEMRSINSADVAKAFQATGKPAVYLQSFTVAANWLKEKITPGDCIITFGTGDPYKATDLLLV